jgi:ketosteroid isomerase-like protein
MPEELVSAECEVSGEALAFLREITARYARRDVEALLEMVTEDIVFDDHRPLGNGETRGHQQVTAFLGTTFEVLPDFKIEVLVLANEADTYLARDTYAGHAAEGGGEALMQWWVVDTLRDGRLEREDIYGTEMEARAEFERRTDRRG